MTDYTYDNNWPPTDGDRSYLNMLYGPNYGNVFTTGQTPTFIFFDLQFQNGGPGPRPTTWTCTDINGTSWSGSIVAVAANIGTDAYQNPYSQFSITPPPGMSSFICGWVPATNHRKLSCNAALWQ